jgi:hypothetical protein
VQNFHKIHHEVLRALLGAAIPGPEIPELLPGIFGDISESLVLCDFLITWHLGDALAKEAACLMTRRATKIEECLAVIQIPRQN